MAHAQRAAVMLALETTSYNIAEAAKNLRIGRSTIYRLMERYELTNFRANGNSSDTAQNAHDGSPGESVASINRSRIVFRNGSYILVKE